MTRQGMSVIHSFTCPVCGKKSYLSRKGARQAARILYPGRRKRIYGCGDYWHFTSQDARTTTAWRTRQSQRDGKVAA